MTAVSQQRLLETLVERSQLMKHSLAKSQDITDNMITILGSFDHRLSDLEAAMRPTQVHTFAIRKAHENINSTLKAAEKILTQFDISRQVETKINQGPQEDLSTYLAAVDQLYNNVEFFNYNNSFKTGNGAVNRANGLLSKAMKNLEEEFRRLLNTHSKVLEASRLLECLPSSMQTSSASPGSKGGDDSLGKNSSPNPHGHMKNGKGGEGLLPSSMPVLIPPRIIPQLQELAQRMITSGHQEQGINIYREVRSSVLEQILQNLGVEKLTREDVHKMPWEVLEGKITNWMQYTRIAMKVFSVERKICDQIFDGLDMQREQAFADITSNSLRMLLSFGEAVAKSKKSPEKLFVLFDMYDTMRELIPEIDEIFAGKSSAEMRESASLLTVKLAQTAQETFGDFEDAVEKDATKTPVSDGIVHPLTSYVINYVKFLCDYQSTIRQLFGEDEAVEPSNTTLAKSTMSIMTALQTNLEGKAKQCKDPALTHIFLMNNIHYMVKSVRRSEAKELLGDDWVQRHRRIVQQHATAYKRVAWGKVLQCLSVQSSGSSGSGSIGNDSNSNSGVSRALLKERFKSFNTQFEELHQKQSQWHVPDTELRESLRLMVAEVLLPAYRSFLKRFGSIMDSNKGPQKYVRYGADDLDRMLGEFFEGKTKTEPRR